MEKVIVSYNTHVVELIVDGLYTPSILLKYSIFQSREISMKRAGLEYMILKREDRGLNQQSPRSPTYLFPPIKNIKLHFAGA